MDYKNPEEVTREWLHKINARIEALEKLSAVGLDAGATPPEIVEATRGTRHKEAIHRR